jgi:hypothetical protein
LWPSVQGYVDGAKLSMGDLHFSQGDGEITFCGAIEMAGYIDLGVVNIFTGGLVLDSGLPPPHNFLSEAMDSLVPCALREIRPGEGLPFATANWWMRGGLTPGTIT